MWVSRGANVVAQGQNEGDWGYLCGWTGAVYERVGAIIRLRRGRMWVSKAASNGGAMGQYVQA